MLAAATRPFLLFYLYSSFTHTGTQLKRDVLAAAAPFLVLFYTWVSLTQADGCKRVHALRSSPLVLLHSLLEFHSHTGRWLQRGALAEASIYPPFTPFFTTQGLLLEVWLKGGVLTAAAPFLLYISTLKFQSHG